ncbi:MAG: hypothetical protein KBC42_03255 [Candidatus Pacebacteria bacterium]|jgi:hypothetical protein|nr:hypothetical protein [Candidatus Paceibacterota bacterium]MBP9780914.1 hypothetical protein [Candidatus Paceibacterota bacterium]
MASVSSAVKSGSNVTDWLLGFIFGYIERFFTVNIPKQFKWMRDCYYPSAKALVNHPKFSSITNSNLRDFTKFLTAVVVVAVGMGLVVALWMWCFLRSLRK